ncbi:MAG: calcineurin-like phosphoesterase C-terminal domain-containing protein [Acetobacteraceae bacterium]|nr:calcineurin-like phosphoesterase C-terminal domain-containing protein [Acetobacteraceae bacterium]
MDAHARPAQLTRREVMAVSAAAIGIASVASAQTGPNEVQEAGPVASGTVFEDTDGSGQHSPASKGLPGIMVSNGRDVVTTGADGTWALPVRDGDSVFVIKPTGWMTPVDPVTQLPRFATVFTLSGTPADLGFRFAGLPPSPLPESIDFPLRRQEEKSTFSAILFTDPQPESLAEIGYIRDDVVAATSGRVAAFGITHGDLMFDDLAHYDRYNRIIGTVGLPWYNACGNHDMNLEAPDNTHSRDTFKRVFGARHYAFQYGGVTFFVLDNVDYGGTDPSKPNGLGTYRGYFDGGQLAFIRNVLATVPQDSLVAYSFHIPLRTLAGSEPNNVTTNTREFLGAISSHSNSVSFSGHTHTNEHWYFGPAEGFGGGTHHHHVLTAVSGSWWSGPFDDRGIPVALATDGTPNGFHLLDIDEKSYRTTLLPAKEPGCASMRIVLDTQLHGDAPEVMRDYHAGTILRGPIEQAAAASTRVVVNVFDGGPRTRVEMAVGRNGPFAPMQKIERIDPFVAEVYARNVATKKPWVRPGLSSHIWQATLPGALPPGTHRVAVRAIDDYGREQVGWMVLEVTA